MTTIVYKDGVIAYDSRVTRGTVIDSDDCDKKIEFEDCKFFLAGTDADFHDLMNGFTSGDIELPRELDAHGFVVTKKKELFFIIPCGFDLMVEKLDNDTPTAIGSGMYFALSAMDCGCTAVEAVKMAIKRDVHSGGRVRRFKV